VQQPAQSQHRPQEVCGAGLRQRQEQDDSVWGPQYADQKERAGAQAQFQGKASVRLCTAEQADGQILVM